MPKPGLSYVGLGAQPPMPSWGRMLFDAQTRMIVAPYLAIIPGMAIVITVLGLNLHRRRHQRHARPKAQAPAVSLLEIENLSLAIGGVPILRDIDLAIEAGEVMGLVGESGSGKSMTALSRHAAAAGGGASRTAASASTASTSSARRKTACARCAATISAWSSRSR